MSAADTLSSTDLSNVTDIDVLVLGGTSATNEVVLTNQFVKVFGTSGVDKVDFVGTASNWASLAGGNDWAELGTGADTVYAGSGADSIGAGTGVDYLDLGTGSDSVYLGGGTGDSLWTADTAGDNVGDMVWFDLADSTSSTDTVDYVFNFEVGEAGAGDSIGFYGAAGYGASGLKVADSVSGLIDDGFIEASAGGDTAFDALGTAIAAIEGTATYALEAGDVFLFRVGSDSYLGVAVGNQDVGPVVKLVGVGASTQSQLVEGSTDGVFYVVPTGG